MIPLAAQAGKPVRHFRFTHGVAALLFAAALGSYFLFPDYLALITQLLVLIVFALSYDLLQGHAGIVSLGHAAFFGLGAYTAAILARAGITDPLAGLGAAAAVSAAVALLLTPIIVQGTDFTRLLVTLGVGSLIYEAANRMRAITGGADGMPDFEVAPVFGLFPFDFNGKTAFFYAFTVFVLVYVFAVACHDFALRACSCAASAKMYAECRRSARPCAGIFPSPTCCPARLPALLAPFSLRPVVLPPSTCWASTGRRKS